MQNMVNFRNFRSDQNVCIQMHVTTIWDRNLKKWLLQEFSIALRIIKLPELLFYVKNCRRI